MGLTHEGPVESNLWHQFSGCITQDLNFGCTDSLACNFQNLPIIENGSCHYPDEGYNCSGECVDDTNENGICDGLEVIGCTDSLAFNFDAEANISM